MLTGTVVNIKESNMTNYKSLLVVIDPTQEHQPALNRALQIADPAKTNITLLLCVYNSSLLLDHLFDDEMTIVAQNAYMAQRAKWLGGILDKQGIDRAQLKIDTLWHKPLFEGIVRYAVKHQFEMVLKSTHKHPIFEHFFFTSNDWQLLSNCPMPLLLVKRPEKPVGRPVLAALAPDHKLSKSSQLDDAIIDNAKQLSEQLATNSHFIHCFDTTAFDLYSGGYYAGISIDFNIPITNPNASEALNYLQEENAKKFTNYLASKQIDTTDADVVPGDPAEQLIAASKQRNAAVLVIGTTHRTGLLGSTAEAVLDNVDCDILAIKPAGFESTISNNV
jgi:universal stress protein E